MFTAEKSPLPFFVLAGPVNAGFITFSGRELQVDWRGALLLRIVQRIGMHLSRAFLNVAVTTFCTKTPEGAFSPKPSQKTQAMVWFP